MILLLDSVFLTSGALSPPSFGRYWKHPVIARISPKPWTDTHCHSETCFITFRGKLCDFCWSSDVFYSWQGNESKKKVFYSVPSQSCNDLITTGKENNTSFCHKKTRKCIIGLTRVHQSLHKKFNLWSWLTYKQKYYSIILSSRNWALNMIDRFSD